MAAACAALTPEQRQAVELLAQPFAALRRRNKRQEGYRALIGGLLRGGMSRSAIKTVVEALCEATEDEEADKRVALIDYTARRLADGKPTCGLPSLILLWKGDGAGIVDEVYKLLGIDSREIVATYDYCDEAGCLRYQVVRFEPKDFRQRRPDGKGGWIWDLRGVERLLYRLPELVTADSAQPVYLVEGEKDTDALRELGLTATCNPMGAGKWQDRFAGPLRGRHIIIIPDHDEPGREHAQTVAASVGPVAASVKVLELPGLPPGGDVSDWLAAGGTVEELKRLANAAPLWRETVPATVVAVPTGPSWPDAMAQEAFHGLAGDVVRVLEPASEADPAALLLQLLVGFGNMLGRTAHCVVEADLHHCNEFAVGVGRTSKGRKGVSWGQVSRLLAAAEEQWAAEQVMTGLSSGQGVIWHVRDPIKKMERVKDHGEDPRYVEVEADPGVTDKRLLVVEAEFANVLKQVEREGNTLSAVLRLGWDCGNLRILNKTSPTKATGAHVSLIGHITAEELRRYMSTTEMANGFGNRFLWSCWRRSKELPDGGQVAESDIHDLIGRLTEALAFGRGLGVVRRDDQARELWRSVYGELSAEHSGLTGAMLGRAEAHVLRLSLLYAVLDQSPSISAAHLMAALAVWDHCERSVRYIWGDSLGDPLADDILRQLRGRPDGMSRGDISNALGRNYAAARIGHAMGLLAEHRLARCERRETGGRPEERWHAMRPGSR